MGAVALVVLALILLAFDVLVGFFGVDSRPGFADGRTDTRERWFIHSRSD
jgi:hypothetical protein